MQCNLKFFYKEVKLLKIGVGFLVGLKVGVCDGFDVGDSEGLVVGF
jgi:hypothetical protein